ncbi:P-loop NTPase fold protein [Klebsiella pneumoniae]|uniref:KAP family P-loop NTPase fold protein n=1 Tax=Klebsiella pneumoniae TaxID=573 RepID=UPI001E653E06|nr:P-loop NTPase fold protein [Klebsiella pneumoniae]MCD5883492.1 KAP family NTPase [Klebsiella pneumoniae]MCK5963296.1 KAP family NTPase [Klebsiella pneumoniae]MDK1859628.1 KAP family NTPase [Klebsiella pneumoniae]
MKIVIQEPDLSNGFDEVDIFNRKKLFHQIVRLIEDSPKKSLVFALDDKWGNGKTTFVKMLQAEIAKENNYAIDAIYFDAFENDYQSDPFISLSSLLYSHVESKKTKGKKVGDKILSGIKKVGSNLLLNGSKFALTAVSGGIISANKIDGIGEVITDSLKSEVEGFIESRIKSTNNEKKDIADFKESLKEIIKVTNNKTLIIIDELDRARPDYALDLLERIKHLFSVDGLIFLLVMNREQFEKGILRRYGDIDSRLYLNKFIHCWFSLPKKNAFSKHVILGNSPTTTFDYISHVLEKNNINSFSSSGAFIRILSYLIDRNNGSLREIERCLSVLAVVDNPYELNKITNNYYNAGLALVVFLKVFNPILLESLITHEINHSDFTFKLKISLPIIKDNIITQNHLNFLTSLIRYHFLSNEELRHARLKNEEWIIDIENLRVNSLRAMIIEDIASSIDNMHIS